MKAPTSHTKRFPPGEIPRCNLVIALTKGEAIERFNPETDQYEGFKSPRAALIALLTNPEMKFRKTAPQLVRVNDIEIEAPLVHEPDIGDLVYLADVASRDVSSYYWDLSEVKRQWLEKGLLHAEPHNAQRHIDAMLIRVVVNTPPGF